MKDFVLCLNYTENYISDSTLDFKAIKCSITWRLITYHYLNVSVQRRIIVGRVFRRHVDCYNRRQHAIRICHSHCYYCCCCYCCWLLIVVCCTRTKLVIMSDQKVYDCDLSYAAPDSKKCLIYRVFGKCFISLFFFPQFFFIYVILIR